jgi:hypothetical protein
MSLATCRGTRTHDVGEVVDDEPHDEPPDDCATRQGTRMRGIGEVVDDERRDEPRDEPRDVPTHSDARYS